MKYDIKWHVPFSKIANRVTGGKDGLIFVANEARKLMDPYVPADTQVLADNVKVYAEGNTGIVEYTSPYAHFQYAGKVFVSEVTGSPWARYLERKVPTDRSLKYQKFRHPLATSYWDKAAFGPRTGDLVNAYQSYISKR